MLSIPKWEGGARLCILITVGKFLCPLLACFITPWAFGVYFSTCSVIMREFSSESRCRTKHAGLRRRLPRQEAFFFFPGCILKHPTHLVGEALGIAGTPLMNRMTTLHSLFFFFSTRPPTPPAFLNPHIKFPSTADWTRFKAAQTSPGCRLYH